MVKVIPTSQRQLLANFEVAEIVNAHQEQEKKKSKAKRVANKADEGLNTVTLEIANYMRKQGRKGDVDSAKAFVSSLRSDSDGAKLTRAEVMQFVNLRPVTPVEVNVIVKDIEERIDEDSVERLANLTEKIEMKSSRFSRRRGNQNRKGTGVSAEVLDEVLKKEGLKGDTDQTDGVDNNLNISIRNREINEPINQEALKAEYKPSRTVTRSYRTTSAEDREEKESSPYSLKAKSPYANNNEAPRAPPVDVEPSSESEDEPPPHRIDSSKGDEDLLLLIEDLKEEIEELQIKLNKKDMLIAEKDFEIKKLKRAAQRRTHQQQPRQSDF